MVPRDVASRNAKQVCDEGRGVGESGLGVNLDFRDSIKRFGVQLIKERYGNLFEMYEKITAEDGYKVPMRIYPAAHYVMGGLWVDYHLMSSIPGLFVGGEANFSDHGANRLGASALMQGLCDGYFVLPATVPHYLSTSSLPNISDDSKEFKEAVGEAESRIKRLMNINGKRTADSFHRELGKLLWNYCGMARNEAGLKKALEAIPALREEFWQNVKVPGDSEDLNQSLEKVNRVADFMEVAELIVNDALERKESCGAHFREESRTEEGEAKRDDANFSHAAVWEFAGDNKKPIRNIEPLSFQYVKPQQRSYK